jgi:hypothetical protein
MVTLTNEEMVRIEGGDWWDAGASALYACIEMLVYL